MDTTETPETPEKQAAPAATSEASPFQTEENIIHRGDYINIREKVPQLKQITVGIGWDQKMFEENPLDVDFSCFLLNKNDQTRDDQDFVFYNNEKACEGAVSHTGDSRTGAGDGDDESISIDLNGIPFDVLKIAFSITIYDAAEREQNFEQIRNLYLRIFDAKEGQEILRYPLSEDDFKSDTGIKVGELIREGPAWYFSALGEPIPGGLGTIATKYGIIITL